MSLLTGELAFLWASIIALPMAIGITAAIFWFYRWSVVQKVVMPGADECRDAEVLAIALMNDPERKPAETAALAQVFHGILVRNGLNAIAVAIIFFCVFTGAHALLLAL